MFAINIKRFEFQMELEDTQEPDRFVSVPLFEWCAACNTSCFYFMIL